MSTQKARPAIFHAISSVLPMLLALAVLGPKIAGSEEPNNKQTLPAPFAKLLSLHKKLPPPRKGDWLAEHHESGQSYRQYLRARPITVDSSHRTIYIQPLGDFSPGRKKIVEGTATFLGIYFQLPVKTNEPLALDIIPDAARRPAEPPRDEQFLSTYILNDVLKPRLPRDAVVQIALTAADLWPGEGWNFVFGQASLSERIGVWSTHRFGDPDQDDEAFRLCLSRTLKVASHETGHMFSMAHCTFFQCNMCGSNSLPETDRHPLELCPHCLAKLCHATKAEPVRRFEELIDFYKENGLKAEQEFCEKLLAALQKKQ